MYPAAIFRLSKNNPSRRHFAVAVAIPLADLNPKASLE